MNIKPEYDPDNDEHDPARTFPWTALLLGEDALDDPEDEEDED